LYARSIGYRPLRGYLFDQSSVLFEKFVEDTYESRLKAKKEGNEPLSFVYKLIMNSLYGRFGISPEYTSTEICGPERYREIVRGDLHIMYSESLGDRYILVCYRNSADCPKVWRPARNAAVQISASVTAYARIYMHRWVSRSDCYYTDTYSVVL